ncbi:MAG: hypothetical protein F6K30_17410 [Cyanothece sp. SIO2G6]|nr:hypothetical protein [Cyanothece sp. SIO2G6]
MRFWFQVLLITGITVGLSGCDTLSGFLPGGGGEEDTAATSEAPTPADSSVANPNAADPNAADPNADPNAVDPNAVDPNAVDPNAAVDEAITNEADVGVFEEPVIVASTPGDLIPSTIPEERIRQVERDRPDPFDILQTIPTIEIPEDVVLVPDDFNGNGNGNGFDEFDPLDVDGDPLLPELDPIAAPPPPPEPLTARAVAVTGVVQIGTVPYAIVNAPNEPHSRYVRSGQLLSNGQVLVKRIELFPGVADPVVVLEEFGIEVNRQVGDNPEAPDTTPDAAQIDV